MDLKSIKGIASGTEQKLNSLGIYTIENLVEFYPYRYNILNLITIDEAKEDESCTIKGVVVDAPKVQYIKRNFNRMTFKIITNKQMVNVTIFNRAFFKQHLTLNKEVVITGKYKRINNSFMASDLKFNISENKIEPVYHLVEGLSNSQMSKYIKEALKLNLYYDYIPNIYTEKYHFINKETAVNLVHEPKSIQDIKSSTLRLKYEELFNFMFKINYLKSINKKVEGIKRDLSSNYLNEFQEQLSFELTKDQLTCMQKIYEDLTNAPRMNRLILGDVGSGKTIVATYAIYLNYLSKHQSALMAPTEILAMQHYKSIQELLSKFNIKTALLTGSTKKKEKEQIMLDLQDGKIDLLIGTHALISDNVKFKSLGLVITDEQHRFGVAQRNNLSEKGLAPDVLYLSATPIPRTYALTIYGDLDLSLIKTKPTGRKEIITKVYKESDIKEVLYKMLEELKLGHQIYVVSPLIEDNDTLDLKSIFALEEKFNLAFKNQVKIGILHGKLKNSEKEIIMNDFKSGELKILISTTVIEVGVDVPNTTMIVIYNAERFGLATLHQLRGRVGRNDMQSYCYLISNKDVERLKVLEESNDGFYISEKDFEMRGGGDLFGNKQSGSANFKIANIKTDYQILMQAALDSEDYINSKLYIGNVYYEKLIDDISFIN